MKNSKKLLSVIIIAMLIIGLVGCSSQPAKPAEKPTIKIGMVMPLTGTAALYGEQAKRGAALAVKQINAKGGILGGSQIEVIYEDDQGKPELAVNATKKLLEKDQVVAISGQPLSSPALAMLPIVNAAGKVFMVTAASHPNVVASGAKTVFQLNTTNVVDHEFYDKYIAETLKLKNVAMIVEKTDFGEIEITEMKKNWATAGPKILTIERFETSQVDFAPQLTSIRSKNPEAVYVACAAPQTTAAIFSQMDQMGLKNVIKLLSPRNLNRDFIKLAGAAAEGIISINFYDASIENATNKQFVADFQAEYKKVPENVENLGYESIVLLATAIDKAGTATDSAKIAEYLHANSFDTPRGTLKFKDTGAAISQHMPLQAVGGNIVVKK